jgi:putative CocE/NonD family hydrolase
MEGDVRMSTRDGVALAADVYRPDAPGPFPVLVRRTPYGKRQNDLAASPNEAQLFASHGYIVVVQDTRGRFGSEGTFYPFVHEGEDTYDAVEWAAGLDGSTGDVGTFGQSYGAMCQYLVAPLRPPHLRTAIPVSGAVSYFRNCVYRDGAFELGWMLAYIVSMSLDTLARHGRHDEMEVLRGYLAMPDVRFSPLTEEAYRLLPLDAWADRLAEGAPYFGDFLRHSTDGPYWWATDMRRQLHNIDVPMLHVGSWYDGFQFDTVALYTGVVRAGLTEAARQGQSLLMGPWGHLLPYFRPSTGGAGDIDFGPAAAIELHDIELRWFGHHLKGAPAGDGVPRVRYFVMGEDDWRDADEWPPPGAAATPYHLRSGGRLTTAAPGDEEPDRFRYNPDDPVPTRGGRFLGLGQGVADQRPNETRPDVLVYASETLERPVEITGQLAMRLFASSSALDTDFVVKLVDVAPDGYARNLADGVVRARFRDSAVDPSPMEPGSVYLFTVDLWSISHLFLAGHRIRVDITSSDFPRWDRNPNTGHLFGVDAEVRVADQMVFHDAARPSHMVLPVMPA